MFATKKPLSLDGILSGFKEVCDQLGEYSNHHLLQSTTKNQQAQDLLQQVKEHEEEAAKADKIFGNITKIIAG